MRESNSQKRNPECKKSKEKKRRSLQATPPCSAALPCPVPALCAPARALVRMPSILFAVRLRDLANAVRFWTRSWVSGWPASAVFAPCPGCPLAAAAVACPAGTSSNLPRPVGGLAGATVLALEIVSRFRPWSRPWSWSGDCRVGDEEAVAPAVAAAFSASSGAGGISLSGLNV